MARPTCRCQITSDMGVAGPATCPRIQKPAASLSQRGPHRAQRCAVRPKSGHELPRWRRSLSDTNQVGLWRCTGCTDSQQSARTRFLKFNAYFTPDLTKRAAPSAFWEGNCMALSEVAERGRRLWRSHCRRWHGCWPSDGKRTLVGCQPGVFTQLHFALAPSPQPRATLALPSRSNSPLAAFP